MSRVVLGVREELKFIMYSMTIFGILVSQGASVSFFKTKLAKLLSTRDFTDV